MDLKDILKYLIDTGNISSFEIEDDEQSVIIEFIDGTKVKFYSGCGPGEMPNLYIDADIL